ncbi:MAG TPA: substrate-binding domain-containing protein, partial [Paracoccaceae bacterium]|nr:substrate-binding domain-containing protein [Paracoccaceae bacterium]
IIMNQTQADDTRVAYLMKKGFPFATHGMTKWAGSHPYFDFDNTTFVRHAMEVLHQRGRKNVYLVLPPQEQNYSGNMRVGAEEAAEKLGLHLLFNSGATSDSAIGEIQTMVLDTLQKHPEIDAILGGSPPALMAATSAAETLGRTVGKDIDIVGKEAIRFLKQFRPSLLVGHEDVKRAGRFLAKAVVQAIREPDKPPMQELDVPENDIE